MDMTGSRIINAPRDVVWAALQDPQVLKECVPGCDSLEGSVADGFTAQVTQKVGPVKAKFKGEVVLSDLDAPNQMRLSGEGKGGAAGFAKGGALVKLAAVEGGTELSYNVEAKVGGKLAQLGSRIIDSFAKKMADQFFNNFQDALEEDEAPEGDDAPVEDAEAAKPKGWFRKMWS